MRDCATSTAGGERVGRGKAAEIASPSCVHGISEILPQILVDVRVRLMCLKLVCAFSSNIRTLAKWLGCVILLTHEQGERRPVGVTPCMYGGMGHVPNRQRQKFRKI